MENSVRALNLGDDDVVAHAGVGHVLDIRNAERLPLDHSHVGLRRPRAQLGLLLLVHSVADGPPAIMPAAAPITAPAPPFRGPPMTAPVMAPSAPPINAPVPVLFCVPFGFTQPVSTTAAVAAAKVKTCNFVFII